MFMFMDVAFNTLIMERTSPIDLSSLVSIIMGHWMGCYSHIWCGVVQATYQCPTGPLGIVSGMDLSYSSSSLTHSQTSDRNYRKWILLIQQLHQKINQSSCLFSSIYFMYTYIIFFYLYIIRFDSIYRISESVIFVKISLTHILIGLNRTLVQVPRVADAL